MSDSNLHISLGLPILVAGGVAGTLKGGRYLRYPDGTPLTNLYQMPREFCRAILVLALTLWAAGGGGCASREPAATAVAREAARGPEPAPPAEQRAEPDGRDGVFRGGIKLVNVAATVTDARGRFVDGLTKDDFRVYEDGEPVEITQFDNERVPVSLGIALDTSGSMDDRKMEAARNALDRFLNDLLGPDDEVFLYRFDDRPVLLQDWTTSRDHLSRAIRDIRGRGGTALYDAVAESLPRIAEGRHRKKALLIISDGNDTNSRTNYWNVPSLIRRTEALVYAIGIDVRTVMQRLERIGGRGLSVRALRELTDDSGGRTEIIRHADDLDPAMAGIARELSRQLPARVPGPACRRRPLAQHPGGGARPRPPGPGAARIRRGALTPGPACSSSTATPGCPAPAPVDLAIHRVMRRVGVAYFQRKGVARFE